VTYKLVCNEVNSEMVLKIGQVIVVTWSSMRALPEVYVCLRAEGIHFRQSQSAHVTNNM